MKARNMPANPRTAARRLATHIARGTAQPTPADGTPVEAPTVANYYAKPQLTGPQKFRVGSAVYGVPKGSRTAVRRGTHGRALGAVEAPDGTVALFDEGMGQAVLNNDNTGSVRLMLSAERARRPKHRYSAPTISGSGMILSLGTATWRLDRGTRTHHVNATTAAVLVDGVPHLLQANARGVVREIAIPEGLRAEMVARYFPATHASEPVAYGVISPGPRQR